MRTFGEKIFLNYTNQTCARGFSIRATPTREERTFFDQEGHPSDAWELTYRYPAENPGHAFAQGGSYIKEFILKNNHFAVVLPMSMGQ